MHGIAHTHTHTLHKNITIRARFSIYFCFILFVYLIFFIHFFFVRFRFRSGCVELYILMATAHLLHFTRYEFDFISFHLVQLHALIKCVRMCMYKFYTCADKVLSAHHAYEFMPLHYCLLDD